MSELWILTKNTDVYRDLIPDTIEHMFFVTRSKWVKSENLHDLVPVVMDDIDLGTDITGVEIKVGISEVYIHTIDRRFPLSMPLTLFEETYKKK